MSKTRTSVALVLLGVAFVVLYRIVIYWLMDDWELDGNYSHGYLVPPLALYLTWERREALRNARVQPSIIGLVMIAISLGLLTAGTLGSETFVARVSLVGSIVGAIWFVLGREHVRILQFPLALLLLMIPIPDIIFNRVTFPLQLIASDVGARTLELAGVPVVREGNLIVLANMTLDVAEACSGIRSLVSLFTLSVIYGYFAVANPVVRGLLMAATVPIAIGANGLRVAATGAAAHVLGPEAAEGFFHSVSGWLVFVVAGVALLGLKRLCDLVSGWRAGAPSTAGQEL